MNAVIECPATQPKADRTRGIRLAFLVSSVSRNAGGLFAAVSALGKGLVGAGSDVSVFGAKDEWTAEDADEWGTVSVSVQPLFGPRAFGFQRKLTTRLRAFAPDLVHVHGLWQYPSLAAVRWSSASRPHLVSPHGMLDPWAVRHSAWKKRLAALLYEDAHLRRATCLHALCDSERDAIRTYGLKNPVCVIPNGVDLPAAPSGIRPDWEDTLPPGAKVLLYLGRIHPKKGLIELLHGWSQARQNKVLPAEWFLVIAGWDQNGHEAQLRTLARELGILDRIRFVGPQFDVAKQASYERAQAFVLPSHSEGLPMTVLEAWSHALPVLMTPQCNLPLGFERGAALMTTADPAAIARCLGELGAMTDAERRSIGIKGRELAQTCFSWRVLAARMRAVYEWVLGGGSPPPEVSL